MKKVLFIILLLSYNHLTNAQTTDKIALANRDTPTATGINGSIEERLNKQEQQLNNLKKENEVIKKQMKQLRSSLNSNNRKFSVSRTGSKQVVIE